VPEGERVEIDDMVRGKVGWDTNTLGDFVLLRSNGMPVYNFCVAVDDATMGITHVLRAEEHLPNTLRQALVYDALKFPRPTFGHMSLILAPDRSKLSKRHGATSVGQFKDQGYLSSTMINYLSLLGWNDGTEQEIYETSELVERFGVDRINKSPAVFDNVKLNWMNGQHIRLLPEEERDAMVGKVLVEKGLAKEAESAFAKKAAAMCANSIELVEDAASEVEAILGYPLAENAEDAKMAKIFEDDFGEIADAVVAGFDSGELRSAIEAGEFKAFVNATGKALERKGKRLFMPFRVALTGRMQGPDVGEVMDLLIAEGVPDKAVKLEERVEALKKMSDKWSK
jgi:glutamyl-tRNA synthetase